MAGRRTKSLAFEPFLVIKNCRKFAPCLLFAEPAHEPSVQIVMRLAAIAGLASGYDIRRYSTGTIGIPERDEMIGGQARMDKQSRRIAAVGTTTVPVFKRGVPIADAKCIRQSLFARIAAVIRGASMFPMSDIPTSVNPFALFGIGAAVLSGTFSKLFRISMVRRSTFGGYNIPVSLVRRPSLENKFIPIILVTLATTFTPLRPMCAVIEAILLLLAIAAQRFSLIYARYVFSECGAWMPLVAYVANLPIGNWCVNHEAIPYWPYIRECGKAVRLAFQTGNYAVLSHLSIIPYAGGIC